MATEIYCSWWVGEAIRDTKTWQFGVTAGLGSGKTHGTYQWHHVLVRQNQGSKFSGDLWPTYQKIHDAGIPTYEKILAACGLRQGKHYKIIKTPFPKLVYLDQSPAHEVHFLSAENPDKIIAVEYSHASEHEAGIITAEASRNLRARVRAPESKRLQVMREGVPQGVNDFAADFDSATLEGWDKSVYRDHFSRSGLQKRRFTIWSDDNPWMRPEYIAQLEDTYGHNPNLIKSYRYGEFCPLVEGATYNAYMPQRHDVKDRDADPYRSIDLMFDFNANPMTWTAVQKFPFLEYEKRVDRWVAIQEANQGAGLLIESLVEFAAKFPVERFGNTLIRVFGDRSGHAHSHRSQGSDYDTIKRVLNELGFRYVEICASKLVALEGESVDALNQLFYKSMLFVCHRCRLLRKSLLATTWKPGTRKIFKPAGETWTHPADSVKYWAWQETRDEVSGVVKVFGANI